MYEDNINFKVSAAQRSLHSFWKFVLVAVSLRPNDSIRIRGTSFALARGKKKKKHFFVGFPILTSSFFLTPSLFYERLFLFLTFFKTPFRV